MSCSIVQYDIIPRDRGLLSHVALSSAKLNLHSGVTVHKPLEKDSWLVEQVHVQ